MTTFVDTNILIDVLQPKSKFYAWSAERLTEAKQSGPVVVSDIVYSEFSVTLPSVQDVDQAIGALDLLRCGYSKHVLFDAGKAYASYRQRAGNGAKRNVLPDFFIGALAHHEKSPLITRDPQKIRAYFPEVTLITP